MYKNSSHFAALCNYDCDMSILHPQPKLQVVRCESSYWFIWKQIMIISLPLWECSFSHEMNAANILYSNWLLLFSITSSLTFLWNGSRPICIPRTLTLAYVAIRMTKKLNCVLWPILMTSHLLLHKRKIIARLEIHNYLSCETFEKALWCYRQKRLLLVFLVIHKNFQFSCGSFFVSAVFLMMLK